ncbi:hypothetical protein HDF10_004197 [Edaphobacter lichenicola]|uniref:Uncharacterized protein n=1 Tax=Tunturiibacter lichenicola TaxID=2051959 RepID=A0A7W8N512_9BACT|nr:hypothetical protein [Edaphobacter lichenicola]
MLNTEIIAGDVGVVLAGKIHHIYLIVDATDQLSPLIADNQEPRLHPRAVAGNVAKKWSPTSYFLRAPSGD